VAPVAAPPVGAIYGQVYIVAPRWWGFCPGSGNYVTQVTAHNFTTGDRAASAPGRDTVFLRVDFNRRNTIVVTASCRLNTPQGSTATISPRYHRQTFYFGSQGGSWTSG
jgi:hypothetical protein